MKKLNFLFLIVIVFSGKAMDLEKQEQAENICYLAYLPEEIKSMIALFCLRNELQEKIKKYYQVQIEAKKNII